MYQFFQVAGKEGWISLGGIVLCVTGVWTASTLQFLCVSQLSHPLNKILIYLCRFGGHVCRPWPFYTIINTGVQFVFVNYIIYNGTSWVKHWWGSWFLRMQAAFLCLVYPCLLLGYIGHAAYLSQNISDVEGSFYLSVPSSSQNFLCG
jgi:hypothetical protein